MKIKVPVKAIELGYDERYLVFMHFMHKLIHHEGKRTHFYFFAKDVKKILGLSMDPHLTKLQSNLKPLFEVGIINPFTLRLTWASLNGTEGPTGLLLTEEYELTDRVALNFYWYLLGRFADKSIVTDGPPKLYTGKEDNYNKLHVSIYRMLD